MIRRYLTLPFDRLVSHQLKTPTFAPFIPPPRPVVNYAQWIVPAVDKIAQSMLYLSPYERQMRGAELAKAQVGQMQAAQQMQLAPQMLDLQRQQLETEKQKQELNRDMFNRYKSGQSGGASPLIWDGKNVRPMTIDEQNKATQLNQRNDEAKNFNDIAAKADQARKAAGVQPQAPTDDDEAFWLKYHAAVAKHGEGNFQYDDEGNPTSNDDNE